MPHVAAWEEEHGMVRRDLDQCQYGAASKKPTTITWKVKGAEKVMHKLEKRCNCRSHGKVLLGLNEEGKFVTTAAARYPSELTHAIAEEHPSSTWSSEGN